MVRRQIRQRLAVMGVVLALVLTAIGSSLGSAGASAPAVAALPSVPLRILVTNDDGVAAAGIASVVDGLQSLPNVEVTVIAPATNQSGTGGNTTAGNITVAPATTLSGDAATSVNGFPADTVLYGVLAGLSQKPHLVVSGINQGQNLGNVTELSGTVGAARTANRLGIPAVAVSQGFAGTMDYNLAAYATAVRVAVHRNDLLAGVPNAQTVNINVPSCAAGTSVRGILNVPLGRTSDIGGYTLQSGAVGNGVFAPNVVTKNAIAASNCASTGTNFTNDIDAFNNGYITLTTINPDFGDR